MHSLLRDLQNRGVTRLHASFRPTPKNVLVQDLLPRLHFDPQPGDDDARHYLRDLTRNPPSQADAFPVTVEWISPAGQ